MAIHENTEIIRQCDVCGKKEGTHLKSSDFYDMPPTLVIKDYDGNKIIVSMEIDVVPFDVDDDNEIMEDVVDSYMDSHNPQIIPIQQIMSMAQSPQQMEYQPIPPSIVCKACYHGMVYMLSNYGKFDKMEEF